VNKKKKKKKKKNFSPKEKTMSRDTKQQVEDLYAMGFIQESEYIARMAAIGESVSKKSMDPTTSTLVSSRDRLISSFDHGFAIDNNLATATVSSSYHHHHHGNASVSRKPFFSGDTKCECSANPCSRCGANVPSCCDEEHRFVCHADSSPMSLLEFDCPLAALGCRARVSAKGWSAHVSRECDYAQVTCRCLVDWLDTAPPLMPNGRWHLQRGVVCLESRLRDATVEHMSTVHQRSMPHTGELVDSPSVHAAVACPLAYLGCKHRTPLAKIAEHLLSCPFNVTVCRSGLSESKLLLRAGIVPVDTPYDATRATDRRLVREYWNEYDASSDSEAVADPSLQPCCFSEQVRTDVAQHNVDSHLSRAVATAGHVAPRLECPLCQRRIGRNRLGAHLKRCEQYQVSCPICFEDIGQRSSADQHHCASKRAPPSFMDELRKVAEKKKLAANAEKPEVVVEQTDFWVESHRW
jgi:hypothetical protein